MRRRWGLYILHVANPDYTIYSGQRFRRYKNAVEKAEVLNTYYQAAKAPWRYRVSRFK